MLSDFFSDSLHQAHNRSRRKSVFLEKSTSHIRSNLLEAALPSIVLDHSNFQATTNQSTMDAIIAGIGAAISFAALHVVHDQILAPQGLSCLCPPLGAVAVLLFCLPSAPASQPKAVVGGHIVAGIVGYAVVESGILYGEAVAVACSIAAMTFFEVVHPPAGAYAFLYVNKRMGWKGIFAPGLVGGIVLVVVQKFINGTLKPMLSRGSKKTKEN